MNLSELIAAYGDDEVVFQKLDDCVETVNMTKKGTKASFVTTERVDFNGFTKLGLIIWLDRDRAAEVLAASRAALTTPKPVEADSLVEALEPFSDWLDTLSLMIGQSDMPDHYKDQLRSLRRDISEALSSTPPAAEVAVGRKLIAYAHCCPGPVEFCDCVNKNHGTAWVHEGHESPALSSAPAPVAVDGREGVVEALQKLPAAFEVLDTENGTYLTRSEIAAQNSGFEYNGLYRRDSAELRAALAHHKQEEA